MVASRGFLSVLRWLGLVGLAPPPAVLQPLFVCAGGSAHPIVE